MHRCYLSALNHLPPLACAAAAAGVAAAAREDLAAIAWSSRQSARIVSGPADPCRRAALLERTPQVVPWTTFRNLLLT